MKAARVRIWFIAVFSLLCALVILLLGLFLFTIRDTAVDNGSPAAEEIPSPDFSGLVNENEKGESVFTISLPDFVDAYNRVYRKTHAANYLTLPNEEHWYEYEERSPSFGYDSVRYRFSADKKVWPMPTISLYDSGQEEIYEIRMTFDDHGYQERLRELFKELCCGMESMLIPELSDKDCEDLFETLYNQSDKNFFGDHHWYGDPERPKLDTVYSCGKIGMYGFYGSGNIEICFVPLSEAALARLESDGILLTDISY